MLANVYTMFSISHKAAAAFSSSNSNCAVCTGFLHVDLNIMLHQVLRVPATWLKEARKWKRNLSWDVNSPKTTLLALSQASFFFFILRCNPPKAEWGLVQPLGIICIWRINSSLSSRGRSRETQLHKPVLSSTWVTSENVCMWCESKNMFSIMFAVVSTHTNHNFIFFCEYVICLHVLLHRLCEVKSVAL